MLTVYFPKGQAQETLFRRGKYISNHRENPNLKCWYGKIFKSDVTCQISAVGKGEEDLAKNPGASYLENKQQILKSNHFSTT